MTAMLTRPMTRRTFGAGVVATGVALAVGCTRDPAPATSHPQGELRLVRVNTGLGLATGREAYLTVAEEKGYFAAEGIRIEVIPGEGTVTNLTQLATGQVDIATIDVNAALVEFAQGTFTDFVLTAVLHAQLLGCVIVRADAGITRPRDLAGKRMAVIPGGTNTILFPAFAQLNGLDAATVELVAPPPPSFGALLAAGEVDAIQQFVLARSAIEREVGQPVHLFTYSDTLPELYGSGLGCSRRFAAEHPDLVRAFNRAALRGLLYAVNNPAEAGEIFAGHRRHEGGQPAPVAAKENELLAPYVRADDGLALGEFDLTRLAQSAGILRSYGLIDTSVRPEELVAPGLFG
jgi:NitT/TauT family transport system substrate-binding protein